MFLPVFVCLKNACMDLDETLRVDRCWDIDELINFSARSHGAGNVLRNTLILTIDAMASRKPVVHF